MNLKANKGFSTLFITLILSAALMIMVVGTQTAVFPFLKDFIIQEKFTQAKKHAFECFSYALLSINQDLENLSLPITFPKCTVLSVEEDSGELEIITSAEVDENNEVKFRAVYDKNTLNMKSVEQT
jgi:hypothetical protein